MAQFSKSGLQSGVPTRIDTSNPLTQKLTYLIAPGNSPYPVDFVKGAKTTSTVGTQVVTPFGKGSHSFVGTAAETAHLDYTSPPFSIFTYIYLAPSAGSFTKLLTRNAYGSEGSNTGYGLETNDAQKFRFIVFNNNGVANYAVTGTTTYAANQRYTVLGTNDGTTRRIYVNGREEASGTLNLSPASSSSGITNSSVGGQRNIVLVGAIWRRSLSAQEAYLLHTNPWQMFKTSDKFATFAPSAAPTVPSLDSWYIPLWFPEPPTIEVVSY